MADVLRLTPTCDLHHVCGQISQFERAFDRELPPMPSGSGTDVSCFSRTTMNFRQESPDLSAIRIPFWELPFDSSRCDSNHSRQSAVAAQCSPSFRPSLE